MPGKVAPLAICSSEASERIDSISGSSATTRPGTRMPRPGILRNPPEIRTHSLEAHTALVAAQLVAGDAVVRRVRRLAHAMPATATSTPMTLASCGTRSGPSQKLSSRRASMAKRPIE